MEPNPLVTQVDLGGMWHIALFAGVSFGIIAWLHGLYFIPRTARVLWAYVLISATFILEWPALHFGPYTTAYQATAGQVIAEAVFIPLLALTLFGRIRQVLPFAALFACACVWGNWPGLMLAPSFNSAFAALCVPFIPWWAALPVIVTVFTHHGSTALLILGAQFFAYSLTYTRPARMLAAWLVCGSCLFLVAHTHQHAPMFDGMERLEHWKTFMQFWAKEPRWIALGVGPGSFMWTSAIMYKFQSPIFLQMHSDWLQILWELGAVGLLLAIAVTIQAIKSAWGNLETFAGVLGCVVFGLTYHPLRFAPTALLIAWIFVRAFVSCKSNSRPARRSNSSESAR